MTMPAIRAPVKKPDDLKFATRVAVASSMQAIGSTAAIPAGPDAERIVRGEYASIDCLQTIIDCSCRILALFMSS
jgi:hypothetical protein